MLAVLNQIESLYVIENHIYYYVHHVLDPTLLLTKEDYMKLVERKGHLDTKEGDLYLYLLDENERNMNLANTISKEMGLKPFTYTSRACDFHGVYTIEERIQPPVELWLKGSDQAKIVLTDSFHACILALYSANNFIFMPIKIEEWSVTRQYSTC